MTLIRRTICRINGHKWVISEHPALRCSRIPIICIRCGNRPNH